MDRYAVFGNPVGHSLSPRIHARFGELTGDRIDYRALEVPLGGFAVFVQAFFDSGARGGNVTLPFKVDAVEMAGHRSERATLAGAANFLHVCDDGIHADNTDGAGLVQDLRANLGIDLDGARLLLVGAGGAARGVVMPLLEAGVDTLTIANRTVARAEELIRHFGSRGRVSASSLEALAGRFDVVVNATSASTQGAALGLPARVFEGAALAYDMMYGPKADAFLARARAAGAARTSDGLGMLVEQAAESFLLWRGRRPPTGPVLAELRARPEG